MQSVIGNIVATFFAAAHSLKRLPKHSFVPAVRAGNVAQARLRLIDNIVCINWMQY
ncbi:UNVERIFIED_ORG: hypothetical protein J2W85_001312 [Ensifer adhaerens]|nr:hypothetical protein [Ensifer adhaerens]